MSILNLNSPQGRGPRGKKTTKIWMGVGLLVAVLGVGSTFASTITINPAGNTEFGQGVEKTVYCGGSTGTLTVTPVSSYRNSSDDSTLGTFFLSAIKVTDIPVECNGVNFVFSLYNSTNNSTTPLPIATVGGSTITVPAVYWRTTGASYKFVKSSDRGSSSYCQKATDGSSSNTTTYGGILSLSRSSYVSPCSVAYLTASSETSFQININDGSSSSTNFDIKTAGRIVIETQNDTFGLATLGLSSPMAYGLVKDGLS